MSEELICKTCAGHGDKSAWGDGPWVNEPDHVLFEHAGLPCILHRNSLGAWCGYAAVPPGHKYHGKGYDDIGVAVHGGLTYADKCFGHICHVAKPGEPDDVWWFGFDCSHAFDLSPAMEARTRALPGYAERMAKYADVKNQDVYRDLAYVRAETESLAAQLGAAA